jgi:ankyrin repeat protein
MNASLNFALVLAADGHLEQVHALLAAGAQPTGMPLLMAIQCDEPEIVAVLLAAGADPNYALPPSDTTPLIRAVTAAYPAIVQLLLAAGADPNAPQPDGTTPLQAVRGRIRTDATDAEREQIQHVLRAAGACGHDSLLP